MNLGGDFSLQIAKSYGFMPEHVGVGHTKFYLTSEVDKSSLPKAIISHVAQGEHEAGLE